MSRILIIDHDPLIRSTVRAILSSARHQVLEAASCSEALERSRESIEVLVLDASMPDGGTARVLLEPKLHGIPAVVLTPRAIGEGSPSEFPGRTVHRIAKPVKSAELLRLIDGLTRTDLASVHV